MHTDNQNNDVSLAKEFQKYLTKSNANMVSLIKENPKKLLVTTKWTYRQFHFQDNADDEHQDVKIYCNTSQFP